MRNINTFQINTTFLEVRPPSEVVGDEVVVLASLALDDHHALRVGHLRDDLLVPRVAHLVDSEM